MGYGTNCRCVRLGQASRSIPAHILRHILRSPGVVAICVGVTERDHRRIAPGIGRGRVRLSAGGRQGGMMS